MDAIFFLRILFFFFVFFHEDVGTKSEMKRIRRTFQNGVYDLRNAKEITDLFAKIC